MPGNTTSSTPYSNVDSDSSAATAANNSSLMSQLGCRKAVEEFVGAADKHLDRSAEADAARSAPESRDRTEGLRPGPKEAMRC